MVKCPQCGYISEEQHNFCPSCGFDLRQINAPEPESSVISETTEPDAPDLVICEVCGEETSAESGYCLSCGAKLSGKEPRAEAPEKKQAPEKKLPPAKPEAIGSQDKPVSKKADSVQKKMPTVQKKQPGKHQSPKSKLAETAKSGSRKDSITPVQIGAIIAGLLVIGAFILYISGVFDSGSSASKDNLTGNGPVEQKPRISLEDFQRLNNLENAVKKDSSNMGTVLELAHGLNDAGRYQDAIKYYNMYLRNNPRNVDVLVDQGVCYFELRDYAHAKIIMRRALQINPRHQIGNFNLGIVNFSSGNLDSAKIMWKKAIELDPNSEIGKKSKELLDSN